MYANIKHFAINDIYTRNDDKILLNAAEHATKRLATTIKLILVLINMWIYAEMCQRAYVQASALAFTIINKKQRREREKFYESGVKAFALNVYLWICIKFVFSDNFASTFYASATLTTPQKFLIVTITTFCKSERLICIVNTLSCFRS